MLTLYHAYRKKKILHVDLQWRDNLLSDLLGKIDVFNAVIQNNPGFQTHMKWFLCFYEQDFQVA